MRLQICCGVLCGCLLCVSCAVPPESPAVASSMPVPVVSSMPAPVTQEAEPAQPDENIIVHRADELAAELCAKSADPYEQVRAAYEYLIAQVWFEPPIGEEAWRLHGGSTPDYCELRAQSPLLFGLGSCEDYAAALALLLERMGFETRYLPGLVISAGGGFVDHAWTAVKIEGMWYHLDPQLEDNVMRNGQLTYRYFLKSDAYMYADHRWGEQMLLCGGFTDAQATEVREHWLLADCPRDAPVPVTKPLEKRSRPDRTALCEMLARERAQYEALHGALPARTQDFTPPVFGDDGYGDPRY